MEPQVKNIEKKAVGVFTTAGRLLLIMLPMIGAIYTVRAADKYIFKGRVKVLAPGE